MTTLETPKGRLLPVLAVAAALAGLLSGTSCSQQGQVDKLLSERQRLTEENRTLAAERGKLSEELDATRAADSEMTATLEEVRDGLQEIRTRELRVLQRTFDVAREGQGPAGIRGELRAEVATIRTAIQGNLAKLARLERERKESGRQLAALQKLADELKASLEEKASTIAALQDKVLDLSRQVDVQAGVIREKDGLLEEREGVIADRTKALNTGYVAVAARKVLKEKGVVDKKGSVLGLGGSWQETGKIDPEVFREIDTTREAELTIPAPAKKVTILPGHPEDSYELVASGTGQSVLKVTDRDAFWHGSRTLVVMIP